jgi:hypothetical protein
MPGVSRGILPNAERRPNNRVAQLRTCLAGIVDLFPLVWRMTSAEDYGRVHRREKTTNLLRLTTTSSAAGTEARLAPASQYWCPDYKTRRIETLAPIDTQLEISSARGFLANSGRRDGVRNQHENCHLSISAQRKMSSSR